MSAPPRRRAADRDPKAVGVAGERIDVGQTRGEEGAAATSISTLTSPAGDGGEHVGTLEPKHTPTLPSVAGCLVLRHRRVEIDRVWHDRGAEDGQIAWAHVD